MLGNSIESNNLRFIKLWKILMYTEENWTIWYQPEIDYKKGMKLTSILTKMKLPNVFNKSYVGIGDSDWKIE